MNAIIPLLLSTSILFFVLFILLVFGMSTKSHRARVKNDMKRIKSQISRDIPEAEW